MSLNSSIVAAQQVDEEDDGEIFKKLLRLSAVAYLRSAPHFCNAYKYSNAKPQSIGSFENCSHVWSYKTGIHSILALYCLRDSIFTQVPYLLKL